MMIVLEKSESWTMTPNLGTQIMITSLSSVLDISHSRLTRSVKHQKARTRKRTFLSPQNKMMMLTTISWNGHWTQSFLGVGPIVWSTTLKNVKHYEFIISNTYTTCRSVHHHNENKTIDQIVTI